VQLTCMAGRDATARIGTRNILLLHGFLGCSSDWEPVAASLAEAGFSCAALDLPGHGGSLRDDDCPWPGSGKPASLTQLAEVVRAAVVHLGWSDCILVGYSLGARVAMTLAAAGCAAVSEVIAISGSPGLQDEHHQAIRLQQDHETAATMRAMPQAHFVEQWYQAPLWAPLRKHPRFADLLQKRRRGGCWATLAGIIEGCSPGTQNLWPWLEGTKHAQGISRPKVSFVVGALDSKFVSVARRIAGLNGGPDDALADHLVCGCRFRCGHSGIGFVEVSHAGHAVHIEQPVGLSNALLYLLQRQ
jgi:isochorismate synthase / 2-succinyl-5-enolpyruvyl-6-hydroxy-3-cyclohexene-1-carboxylate synthase / 2-succinyl-6-hydroxy-2,4-cyclohexadiene-1-carboxylate synthase / o-succinylbenzoate synthase